MYKKILVPLDGSEQAESVLPHACTLAENTWAELILLRVIADLPTGPLLFRRPLGSLEDEGVDDVRLFTQGYLERLAEKLRARNLKVTTEVCSGPAAETILRCAENLHADIIVMCTHGESGPTPWLRDDTTQQVTRQAKIPVLLIGGAYITPRRPSHMEGARWASS